MEGRDRMPDFRLLASPFAPLLSSSLPAPCFLLRAHHSSRSDRTKRNYFLLLFRLTIHCRPPFSVLSPQSSVLSPQSPCSPLHHLSRFSIHDSLFTAPTRFSLPASSLPRPWRGFTRHSSLVTCHSSLFTAHRSPAFALHLQETNSVGQGNRRN